MFTTSRQLEALFGHPPVPVLALELEVSASLCDPAQAGPITGQLAARADEALKEGVTPVLYTSRAVATGSDAERQLDIGAAVSAALSGTVRLIGHRPAWLLAKGGITSSDVAVTGLGVLEARVIGPLLPGSRSGAAVPARGGRD